MLPELPAAWVAALAVVLVAALLQWWRLRRRPVRHGTSGLPEAARAQKKAAATFTAQEVARHAAPDDAWIIVGGKVYDVTEYVEEHPGGDAILAHAGGDATTGFHGPQHPSRVFDHIELFYIGDLAMS
eukprot:SM000102S09184  [mRNA]  locus=s102:160005:161361:+ [translate_table: standard]